MLYCSNRLHWSILYLKLTWSRALENVNQLYEKIDTFHIEHEIYNQNDSESIQCVSYGPPTTSSLFLKSLPVLCGSITCTYHIAFNFLDNYSARAWTGLAAPWSSSSTNNGASRLSTSRITFYESTESTRRTKCARASWVLNIFFYNLCMVKYEIFNFNQIVCSFSLVLCKRCEVGNTSNNEEEVMKLESCVPFTR